jgi:hypothetical protein
VEESNERKVKEMSNHKTGVLSISRSRLVWTMVALVLTAMVVTVSAGTWLSSREPMAESLPAPASPQSNPTAQQQERGVIRLLTSGFSQTEVSGTSGQYRLVVTRSSQNEEVILQLKTDSGQLIREIEIPQEKLDWTTLIELEAGSYQLSVVNHLEWVCHITVQ